MKNLSIWKILGILFSVLIALSPFLPYIRTEVSGMSRSASLIQGGDGYIVLGIAAAGLVFSFLGIHLVALLAGAAGVIFFFVENANITGAIEQKTGHILTPELMRQFFPYGAGHYLLVIGSAALIVVSALAIYAGVRGKRKR